MTARILVVDDEEDMRRLLQLDLEQAGYEVVSAKDGQTAMACYEAHQPDLVVLDVALPDTNGLEVCRQIRAFSDVPILMMTGHAVSEQEIAAGLDAGGDEYMIKPLGPIEFKARINALLRRARLHQQPAHQPVKYQDGYLSIDLNTRKVRVDDDDVRLTPTEFNLLATFIRNSGKVLTFQQLLQAVWGEEYRHEHHYPRIYVSHLRKKIEPDYKNPTYIHNEYGVGYRFALPSGHYSTRFND